MSLLSASEIAAIQSLAESGMITSVAIYNATTEQTEDGQRTVYPATPSLTIDGWVYNQLGGASTMAVLDGGEGIAEQIRLTVPVGTNVNPGDKVVIDGLAYFTQHTSAGDTYAPWLRVYLRIIE